MQFSQLTAWALMLLTVSPMVAAHANPAAIADESALEARALFKPKPAKTPVKPPATPAPKPTAKPTVTPASKPTAKSTKPTSPASAKPSTLSTVTKSSSAAPKASSAAPACKLRKPALAKRAIPASVTCDVQPGGVDGRAPTTYTSAYLQASLSEGLRHTQCGTQVKRYPFGFRNSEGLTLDSACGSGPWIEFPLWDSQTKVYGLTGLTPTFDAAGEVSNEDTNTQLNKIKNLADRVIYDNSGNFCGVTTHRGHPGAGVHLCT